MNFANGRKTIIPYIYTSKYIFMGTQKQYKWESGVQRDRREIAEHGVNKLKENTAYNAVQYSERNAKL